MPRTWLNLSKIAGLEILRAKAELTKLVMWQILNKTMILGISPKIWLTPINFLYIGINRGQGTDFG